MPTQPILDTYKTEGHVRRVANVLNLPFEHVQAIIQGHIRTLYAEGQSHRQIAAAMGVHTTTICRMLKRMGVTSRKHGGINNMSHAEHLDITINGVTKKLYEWIRVYHPQAEDIHKVYSLVYHRIFIYHWQPERALTQPVCHKH